MIKVYFSDPGCGVLEIEKELGITEDVETYLIESIPELDLESTDCAYDLDDNLILWFSADDEEKCIQKIHEVLKQHISAQSKMKYTITTTSDFSWYD